MLRRFKDFKKTTASSVSQEEIEKYLNTVGNTGADHSHQEWNQEDAPTKDLGNTDVELHDDRSEIEKKHTIERDAARGRKIFEKESHNKEDSEGGK